MENAMIEITISVPRRNVLSLLQHTDSRNAFTGMISDLLLKILDQYKPKKIKIPSTIYHSREQSKNTTCTICMEPLQVYSNIKILSCEHGFHSMCMDKALQYQHRKCPVCRHDISISSDSD
jgi:hypothetical protein